MAFFDWDGDGKKTICDDYIEYNIYKDVVGDDDDSKTELPRRTPSSSADTRARWIALIILLVLIDVSQADLLSCCWSCWQSL